MELSIAGTGLTTGLPLPGSALHPVAQGRYAATLGLSDVVASRSVLQQAHGSRVGLDGLRLWCEGVSAAGVGTRESTTERLVALLAQELCAPFRLRDRYAFELSAVQTRIAPVDEPVRATARRVVQCAYGLRYLGACGAALEELDDERLECTGEASTVVALAQQRGVPRVVGTLRFIVGARLSMFDFFSPEGAASWPHASGVPAEYTRLAFHPIFDRMRDAAGDLQRDLARFYKILVLRKLASACIAEVLRKGIRSIYFIAAPHVVRFLLAGGSRVQPLTRVVPIDSEFTRSVRDAFPRYWRAGDARQQPVPYTLGTELAEVTLPIGQRRIVIGSDNSLRLE